MKPNPIISRIKYTDSFLLGKLFSESNQVHFQNTFPFLERKYVLTPLIADWFISKIKYTDSFFLVKLSPESKQVHFQNTFPRIQKSVHYRLTNQNEATACILNFSFQKVRTYPARRWLVHFNSLYTDPFLLVKLSSESKQVHFQNTFPRIQKSVHYWLTNQNEATACILIPHRWLVHFNSLYTDPFFLGKLFSESPQVHFQNTFLRIQESSILKKAIEKVVEPFKHHPLHTLLPYILCIFLHSHLILEISVWHFQSSKMKIFFSENFSQNSAIQFSKYFSFQKTNFCRPSLIGWFCRTSLIGWFFGRRWLAGF